MYVLAGGQKQDFDIQLVGHDGTVLAKGKLKTRAGDWHDNRDRYPNGIIEMRDYAPMKPQLKFELGI